MQNALQLIFCVVAIYASFLSWSYLQEKLTSSDYALDVANSPSYFHAPLVINIVQCIFCIISGSFYLLLKVKQAKSSKGSEISQIDFFPQLSKKTLLTLYAISLSQSISAPLSYMSLDHVDYVLYLLAKSCKLIPVMLVHYVAFGTIYPAYKYIVAFIITSGVAIFTIGGMKSGSKSPGEDGNAVLGLAMLGGSLLLDGFMNSAQDMMFKSSGNNLTGAHLMIYLNLFTLINLSVYTLAFTSQFDKVHEFIIVNGSAVLSDLLKFSICGALGQIFIFVTLEKFSSVVLVTVTVTRKMLSMVLSVFLFGHVLTAKQWLGLLFVFFGVGLESAIKIFQKKPKHEKKE